MNEENLKIELTITTSELKKAVNIAGSAVQPNSIVPAMELILFRVLPKGKKLEVTGSGSSITIVTEASFLEINSNDFDEDSFTIPFASLSALVKTLPETPITILYYRDAKAFANAHKVVIRENENEYEFAVEDPNFFVKMIPGEGTSFNMDAGQLWEGLKYTKNCIGTDFDMIAWTYCIYVNCDGENIVIAGTNGQKFAVVETKDPGNLPGGTFLMHPKMVSFLSGQLNEKSTGQIVFNKSENNVTVEYNGFKATASVMVSPYPPYQRVIDMGSDHDTAIILEDLKSVMQRSIIFSDSTTTATRMKFEGNLMFISGEDEVKGKKAKQHVMLQNEVEPFEIATSGTMLQSVISAASGQSDVRYSTKSKNLFFYPENHNCKSVLLMVALLKV